MGLILRMAAGVAGSLPDGLRRALYHTGPLAGAIRWLLTRAAPDHPVEVTVAAGPLAGARLSLDLKAEKTLWLGNYEPELMLAIQRFGREGMLAYDVGANIGYVSLALARHAGERGSVVAFEPLPANLARLRSNLERNREGARVTVVGAAVADRSGNSEFLVHPSGGMGKLAGVAGRQAEYRGTVSVEQLKLDDWFSDQVGAKPDLVKIDVEGGEGLVLRGMQELLGTARPVLLVELHGQQAAEQALESLQRAGYRVLEMNRDYPVFKPGRSWKSYVVALPEEVNWSD